MKVLLCAATELEIRPMIQQVSSTEKTEVEILITGVGLMAATYALTKAVFENRPGFVIQAGIAGALDKDISLGEVVAVESETLGDSGVFENNSFQSLFNLKLINPDLYPWSGGRLVNEGVHRLPGLKKVAGLTVNQISTAEEQINYYREELGVDLETLEGAALHYVALLEKIPFIQLRAISNYIGERDKKKWLVQDAVNNLHRQIQETIKNLPHEEA